MAGYTVLSRPEGTTAYKQGAGSQILGGLSQLLQTGIGGYAKHKQNTIARRAAANLLGIPEDQVPLGITMQDVVDLQKSKFQESLKPKEWKPTTKEEALEFEKIKKAKDELNIEDIKTLFGQENAPPGTLLKYKNLTIPINPKLTQEQAASVAAASEVKDDVNSFKDLLTKHAGEPGAIAKLTLPYAFVGGETEEMKRITDQLRARIPFAKGGKQLTPFEAKTLFQLLPQPGQSKETIVRNLDKFVSEFNRMSEIATKGTAGIGQQRGNKTSSGVSFIIE